MSRGGFQQGSRLQADPNRTWVLASFLCFTLTGALLSYIPLPAAWEILLGCLGILGPLAFILWKAKASSSGPFQGGEAPFKPGVPAWVAVALAAAGLRIFQAIALRGFPLYDEAINGFYAMDLAQKGNGAFFYSATQVPPFNIWSLAAAFKFFGPSLTVLRLVPALVSFLAVLVSYAAAKRFFSEGLSFLVFLLVALGFWPLLAGGFVHEGGLVLLWEGAGFWLLGGWDRASTPKSRLVQAVLLGLCVGSGFYTYFSWILAALFLVLAFGKKAFEAPEKERTGLGLGFALAFGFAVLPLAVSAVRTGFGKYLWDLFILNPQAPRDPSLGWPGLALYNLSMVFWRGWKGSFSYGPAWGGLLNPVMGGFFFVGLAEILRHRRHPAALWTGLAFLAGWGPLLFSRTLNSFHLIQLLPLFFLLAALGLQRLFGAFPRKQAAWGAAGLILLSLFLDGVNLRRTGLDLDTAHPAQKPPLDVKAWGILRDFSEKQGPGLFFSAFNLEQARPPFLTVACASFNAVDNPRIPVGKCAWVAWMGNVNYQPFLKSRFPGGRYFWLSKENPPADGGTLLWVAPLTPEQVPAFQKWREADLALSPFEETNLLKISPEDPQAVLESLRPAYPAFQGDPLLESFYWERIADIRTQALWLSSYQKITGRGLAEMPSGPLAFQGLDPSKWDGPLQDLESALRLGCPAAHLYYRLGVLYSLAGKKSLARQAFRDAAKAPLDFTQSRALLAGLTAEAGQKGGAP